MKTLKQYILESVDFGKADKLVERLATELSRIDRQVSVETCVGEDGWKEICIEVPVPEDSFDKKELSKSFERAAEKYGKEIGIGKPESVGDLIDFMLEWMESDEKSTYLPFPTEGDEVDPEECAVTVAAFVESVFHVYDLYTSGNTLNKVEKTVGKYIADIKKLM